MSDQQAASSKRVLIIAADSATSPTTGWPIGFWWAELVHPYWTFVEAGYAVDIVSPKGGDLIGDSFSDPEDASGYAAHDILSLGFKKSPTHAGLIRSVRPLSAIRADDYDAILVIGGQSPMVTQIDDATLHAFIARFYETGKPIALICHGTCNLLKVKLSNGELLVRGRTWTGFANTEEDFADGFVGKPIQPFRIETEAKKLSHTNFIVGPAFKPFTVRDGNLITGQQQNSGAAAAREIVAALGA
jgi:putative intracellular protease/amidase